MNPSSSTAPLPRKGPELSWPTRFRISSLQLNPKPGMGMRIFDPNRDSRGFQNLIRLGLRVGRCKTLSEERQTRPSPEKENWSPGTETNQTLSYGRWILLRNSGAEAGPVTWLRVGSLRLGEARRGFFLFFPPSPRPSTMSRVVEVVFDSSSHLLFASPRLPESTSPRQQTGSATS